MNNRHETDGFDTEIQSLREVIPHAKKVGAEKTNISIELLTRLLDLHAASKAIAAHDPETAQTA